jgi:hypothetical protein
MNCNITPGIAILLQELQYYSRNCNITPGIPILLQEFQYYSRGLRYPGIN